MTRAFFLRLVAGYIISVLLLVILKIHFNDIGVGVAGFIAALAVVAYAIWGERHDAKIDKHKRE